MSDAFCSTADEIMWLTILMIGAAARNVGKTEFACRLIAQWKGRQPVVGIKVTTVRERDGRCPRGGEGCGACSSLKTPYCITEEQNAEGHKDTCRMLRAGADSVFWLRAFAELERRLASK